jgi:predicted amidohydrolase
MRCDGAQWGADLMRLFKIAAAQVPSVRGDVEKNIATHAAAIMAAAKHDVAVLVFPELSLTGYEPDLAAELAITPADSRLTPLMELARQHRIETVIGAPLHNGADKPALGAILFTAGGETRTYRKMHLGGSEPMYFTPGDAPLALAVSGHTVGLAICADSSQPSHPQTYAEMGADIYAAGVFLNAEWYASDAPRLAHYAERYQMLTLMANHGASVGTHTSVGRSAAWAPGGALLAQAEGAETALLIATSDKGAWRGEVIRV